MTHSQSKIVLGPEMSCNVQTGIWQVRKHGLTDLLNKRNLLSNIKTLHVNVKIKALRPSNFKDKHSHLVFILDIWNSFCKILFPWNKRPLLKPDGLEDPEKACLQMSCENEFLKSSREKGCRDGRKPTKKLRAAGNGVTETGNLNCNSRPEAMCVIYHQTCGENGWIRLEGK